MTNSSSSVDLVGSLDSVQAPLDVQSKQPLVPLDGIAIGHPRQVIADRARPAVLAGAATAIVTNFRRVLGEILEKRSQHAHGSTVGFVHFRTVIQLSVQIFAETHV